VSRTQRALLLCALAQLAIGAAAIFARFALVTGGPLAVSAARLSLASIPVLILAGLRGRLRRVDPRTARTLALAGLVLAVHFAAWIGSLRFASVAISTLLVCTVPVWTEAIAIGQRRRIAPLPAASILGALAGVALVVGIPDRANTPLGIALALLGALAFAVYLLIVRATDARYDTLTVIARTYPLAALALLAATAATHDPFPAAGDLRGWLGIVAMALLSQLFGHTALNAAVRVLSATLVATMTLLEPLIAAALAAWIFAERLRPLTALGALIVLGAIALAIRAESGSGQVGADDDQQGQAPGEEAGGESGQAGMRR
jgi:drug/metabolite transporter (DMT)-like permease